MSAVKTFIGNIKGPKGDTGATGATGPAGEDGKAAGVRVGTVQTVSYGSPASVTNSGTENEAVLDFQIPQGAPGSEVTDMASLGLSAIEDPTAEYPAFAVGENGSTIFGKIRKYLSDLKTNYLAKSNLVNGFTQTAAGTNALDAAAGKTLNDSISSLKTDLTNNQTRLNNAGLASMNTNNWDNTQDLRSVAGNYNGGNYRVYAADASTLIGAPVTSGAFVAYRNQFGYAPVGGTLFHAIVILWEVHPVPGRVWANVYNAGWKGWKSVTLS